MGDELQLTPHFPVGLTTKVNTELTVSGSLTYQGREKIQRRKLNVTGHLEYLERYDKVPQNPYVFGTAERAAGLATLRHYRDVKVRVEVDKNQIRPRLGKKSRLISSVLTARKGLVLNSASSFLTREELDLVDIQFPPTLLHELLPNGEVRVGRKWAPTESVLAAVLRIDAISKTTVQGRLESATSERAVCSLSGEVTGAIRGVATDIDVSGSIEFDRTAKRVTRGTFQIKEKRSIGHAEPGLEVEAKIVVSVTPFEPSQLLKNWSGNHNMEPQPLRFVANSGIRVLQQRSWHAMLNRVDLAVLRMIDRGDLIAQCNLAPLPKLLPNQDISMAEFQRTIKQNLGSVFGQFHEATQTTTKANIRVLRVVASGVVADVPIHWIYYLVSQPEGRRASLVFTLESGLLERFGEADRLFVSGLEFGPAAVPKTARQPGRARRP